MSFTWPDKDPDEILRYTHDWSARLDGDTIQDVFCIIAEGDVTLNKPTDLSGPTVQEVWLEGGTLGTNVRLTLRATTVEGQSFDEGIKLKIKSR